MFKPTGRNTNPPPEPMSTQTTYTNKKYNKNEFYHISHESDSDDEQNFQSTSRSPEID